MAISIPGATSSDGGSGGDPRHDTEVVYPVAEYTRFDPLMQEKNAEQGRNPADRADLRFGTGPDNQVFILNKHDGVIRRLTSG